MAPEDELCLLLARAEVPKSVQERASELLSCPIQWPLVLDRARIYDVLPLLYHNLERLAFAGVLNSARAELARIFAVNALRNELLARELAAVLRLLGDARVPVVALKGVALAESLYGDVSLRTCADIDILVAPKNAGQALKLIMSYGYEPEFNQPALMDLLARYGKDCTVTRLEGSRAYHLELHCGLVWGGALERSLLEEIWSSVRRITFRGIPTLGLSTDWQFLYLAQHAARHGPPSLKWLLDLDRLCRTEDLDWKSISAKAQRLGWEKMVESSLSDCASLFDTPIAPVFFFTTFRRPRQFASPRQSEFQVPSDFVFSLRLLRTWTAKARYLAIRLLIPTPADCRFFRLSPSLFFLYYVLRPIRLAGQALGWLIRFRFATWGYEAGTLTR